jgi:hypothetical protein
MCESFFATLECELLDRQRFKTQTEARSAVFTFIEGFYNPRRRHSSIGYLSPIDYERRHLSTAIDPDARQPAVVLTAVKDKPSGRPQQGPSLTAAVRDGSRRSAACQRGGTGPALTRRSHQAGHSTDRGWPAGTQLPLAVNGPCDSGAQHNHHRYHAQLSIGRSDQADNHPA